MSPTSVDEIRKCFQGLLDHNEDGTEQIVQGCIGCQQSSHLQRPEAPFPKGMMAVVLTMSMVNALPIQILYPYLYFMVKGFHVNEHAIGTYAGLIGSGYMIGRTATGFIWGFVADNYGRRPVIFCGLLSMIVFNFLFGVSKVFWLALASRILLGCCNGLFVILAVYATEICSVKHRPFGLSTNTTVWGFGMIIGPAIGGYLSKPAEKYPSVFKNTIFDRFPYLLPPMVLSCFAFFLMFSLFKLPETRHSHATRVTTLRAYKNNSIFKNYDFWMSNAVYCTWAFHEIAYNETFPLWAVSPGGLRWSSQAVGLILVLTGCCLVINLLFIFPRLVNLCGPLLLARTGALLSIMVVAAYPYLTNLHGVLCYAVVIITVILKTGLSGITITALFILMNNSVEKSQVGTANGISTSLVSLARALGPTVGGTIFSWAQSRPDARFLPGNQLHFTFLAAVAILVFVGTFEPVLPKSIDKPVEN